MGAVSEHPQVEEIRNHLLKYDMSVDDIVAKYSTDEHPLGVASTRLRRLMNGSTTPMRQAA